MPVSGHADKNLRFGGAGIAAASASARDVRDSLETSRNCAQTSFSVLQREFALDGADILRALTAFPGIALRGETCGAVTGCLMAIGSVYGRDRLDDRQGYQAALSVSRDFCRRFEEAHGSTFCADLLEAKVGRRVNLADRRGSLEYVAAGGPEACVAVVASAVEIAAEIIQARRPRAVTASVRELEGGGNQRRGACQVGRRRRQPSRGG